MGPLSTRCSLSLLVTVIASEKVFCHLDLGLHPSLHAPGETQIHMPNRPSDDPRFKDYLP